MSFLAVVDWNSILQPPGLPVILLITVAGAVGLAAIIAPQVRRTAEARLKDRMVHRGFTADAIQTVLDAGTHRGRVHKSEHQREFLQPNAS